MCEEFEEKARHGISGGMRKSMMLVGKILAIRSTSDADCVCEIPVAPKEEAFAVTIQLREVTCLKLWKNGQLVREGSQPKAALAIEDLRDEWRHHFGSPFDQVGFHIPFSRIKAFAATTGRPQFTSLSCEAGATDEVVRGIAQSVAPFIDRPEAVSPFFLEQLDLALLAHLAQNYGGVHFPAKKKGTLATWQQQRATEFLTAHFNSQISINTLAEACELSRSHFMKSFKETFGKTPHRWLTEYRVILAKEQLLTDIPIADIAVSCGFADQSHLTRVFAEIAGASPGNWRRQNRVFRPKTVV